MNALLKTYRNVLSKFPVGVQAVQTGLLMGSGDFIAQVFVEQKPLQKIELLRIGQFTLIGTCFVGPSLRIWYGLLENYFGRKGKTAALKKVAADQLLFAPTFLAAIMGIVGVVQGNSTKEIRIRIERDYTDVLKNNYKLWPGVQLCNFYLVPLQYQVVTVQLVAIIWNTYLSWKMNQPVPDRLNVSSTRNRKFLTGRQPVSLIKKTAPIEFITCDDILWRPRFREAKFFFKILGQTFEFEKLIRILNREAEEYKKAVDPT